MKTGNTDDAYTEGKGRTGKFNNDFQRDKGTGMRGQRRPSAEGC